MTRQLFALSVLSLALAAPARAEDPTQDPNSRPDEGAHVEPVPGFSIKTEIQGLGDSMKKFDSLVGSLNRANKDLGDEFAKYLKDPNNQVVASSLERKMASYAAQVQGEFSGVISEQDTLSSHFRMLRQKLQGLSGQIGGKASGFQEHYKAYADEARTQEKALIELAVKIKENPPTDPDELKKLKREFLNKQRSYQFKERYAKGYAARLQNYQMLRKNLDRLSDLFDTLHQRFGDLMENLANEKQYLRDAMGLQADTLKIKQMIRDGMFGGENTLKNVTEKLASLYVKVDAFTQINDRVNNDLNRFVESQTGLAELGGKIDLIGQSKIGAQENQDLEKSINEFYERRDAPLASADEDILKSTRAEPPK
jgi:hypothetical protein